jgi:hypothetical protein
MIMRVSSLLSAALIVLGSLDPVVAQKKPIEFKASDLSRAAFTLTGDSTTWPVIVSLAVREVISNSFSLSVSAQNRLREFALEHGNVQRSRQQVSSLIKNGARVFASAELDSVTKFFSSYDRAIRDGSLEEAHRQASQIITGTARVEKLIDENRNEPIDARLAQKTGTVDKRRGYLGAWQTAFLGDLFVADDGVKTGEASMALLSFVDGVDVNVDPNTVVIIRASQRDRLSQTVKRNIALVNGSLLTRLSQKAKETNDLSFEAGQSASSVKSVKFWASAKGDLNAKLSNYDGTIDLSANNVRVTLQSNQGTVVKKGQPPLQPITLLTAPQASWPRSDSVIYVDRLFLEWEKIAGAVRYEVEASPSKDFDREMKRFVTSSTKFELLGVPLGGTFIRLHGIDKYGLRGIDSPVYTLIRTRNTLPPPIQIDGWNADVRYTVLEDMTIHGKTRTDVALSINGESVNLDPAGAFSYVAHLQKPQTTLNILAQDKSGNTSRRTLTIVSMDTSTVFRIDWNCSAVGGELSPADESIEARGTAYPHVRVVAELGDQKVVVSTSSQGNWAVSLKPVRGSTLRLTFESIDDSRPIGTKTWEVK